MTCPETILSSAETTSAELPDWVRTGEVVHVVDADAMLAAGVHPLGLVRARAATLHAGELLRLDVSFRPSPLVDALRGAGHPVWLHADGRQVRVFVGAS